MKQLKYFIDERIVQRQLEREAEARAANERQDLIMRLEAWAAEQAIELIEHHHGVRLVGFGFRAVAEAIDSNINEIPNKFQIILSIKNQKGFVSHIKPSELFVTVGRDVLAVNGLMSELWWEVVHTTNQYNSAIENSFDNLADALIWAVFGEFDPVEPHISLELVTV